MKQYLLGVMHDGSPLPTGDAMQRIYTKVDKLNAEIQEKGAWVFGGGLHEPSATTVVKAHGDEILVTDGPFVEAKEYLGGFWVLKCSDLDEALEWARKATVACGASIEVRPFQEEPAD